MRNALFWGFTRRWMVIPHRRFRTNTSTTAWPLKMGLIVCPKTFIRNYHLPCLKPQNKDSESHFNTLSHRLSSVWRKQPKAYQESRNLGGVEILIACSVSWLRIYMNDVSHLPLVQTVNPSSLCSCSGGTSCHKHRLDLLRVQQGERVQKLRAAVSDCSSRPKFNG
jgi:hypothetical protein